MWRATLLTLLLAKTSAVIADSDGNVFFNPSPAGQNKDFSANQVWTIGEVETIQWTTTYDEYYITLFQQEFVGNPIIAKESVYSTSTQNEAMRTRAE
jgi:hypothetical protein